MAVIKYAGQEAISRIADYVNQKLAFVSSMPESPKTDAVVLYVGATDSSYIQGGIYKYDGTNWKQIDIYGIITSINNLPSNLSVNDKKLYFNIEDECFYYWTGTQWKKIQKIASYSNLGYVQIDEETLNVDQNGVVSIRTISSADLQSLFN